MLPKIAWHSRPSVLIPLGLAAMLLLPLEFDCSSEGNPVVALEDDATPELAKGELPLFDLSTLV